MSSVTPDVGLINDVLSSEVFDELPDQAYVEEAAAFQWSMLFNSSQTAAPFLICTSEGRSGVLELQMKLSQSALLPLYSNGTLSCYVAYALATMLTNITVTAERIKYVTPMLSVLKVSKDLFSKVSSGEVFTEDIEGYWGLRVVLAPGVGQFSTNLVNLIRRMQRQLRSGSYLQRINGEFLWSAIKPPPADATTTDGSGGNWSPPGGWSSGGVGGVGNHGNGNGNGNGISNSNVNGDSNSNGNGDSNGNSNSNGASSNPALPWWAWPWSWGNQVGEAPTISPGPYGGPASGGHLRGGGKGGIQLQYRHKGRINGLLEAAPPRQALWMQHINSVISGEAKCNFNNLLISAQKPYLRVSRLDTLLDPTLDPELSRNQTVSCLITLLAFLTIDPAVMFVEDYPTITNHNQVRQADRQTDQAGGQARRQAVFY